MRITFRIVVIGVLSVLLLAVVPGIAGAAPLPQQPGGEVTYDAPVEGAITNEVLSQDWSFTAQAADRINVRVERLEGNLIPDVTILDNNGQEIAYSYGSDYTYAVAEIGDFTLPVATTYTVRVERYNAADGVTTGAYRLTVTPLGVAEDHPNNVAVVGPVQFDTPVAGEITPSHWRHVYTLDAETGDYIQVTSQRVSGTLIPEVWLLDSNGQELTRGYSSYVGDSATISGYELPYTGQYQVLALRESGIAGDSVGGFELTVSLLGSGEESARLTSVTPGLIDQYNTTLQGTITGAQWYQDWQFRTQAGDTVTIMAWRAPEYTPDTPNVLSPSVLLLDDSGQELYRGYVDYTGAQATIERYTLPGEGQYTVRVTRDGDKDGATTGSYAFTVTLDGSGEGSPLLAESAGTLTAGTPATGVIDGARWMNTWTFSGQEGQAVTMAVTRTDGTLVPHLEILDSDGVSETSAYPDDTMATAQIEAYTLPYTGEYQIVVSRDSGQDGYTSGGYSLTVQ
jgi:hypothetical protein